MKTSKIVRILSLCDKLNFLDTDEALQTKQDTKAYFYANPKPKYILYGHQSAVTAVVLTTDEDVCISGSFGMVVIHNLQNGDFIRHVQIQNEENELVSVDKILFDCVTGNWLVYSQSGSALLLYSFNGRRIKIVQTFDEIVDLSLTTDGQFLIHGTNCFRNQTHNIVTRDFLTYAFL